VGKDRAKEVGSRRSVHVEFESGDVDLNGALSNPRVKVELTRLDQLGRQLVEKATGGR
jgi:hypothetical protein